MTDIKPGISRPIWIISCAVSLIVGIIGTVLYHNTVISHESQRSRDPWIVLSTPSDNDEAVLTYSSDALFKSDIKLPPVKSLTGKAKFILDATSRNEANIKLGYIVDTDIAPLDTAKLPDKYKPVAENPGDKKPPLDAVYYDVVFYFILKDKDGFPLMKVTSNKETVHSGAVNHFQLFAKTYIPQQIASSTKIINVRMEAIKCMTCSPDHEDEQKPVRRRHSLFPL